MQTIFRNPLKFFSPQAKFLAESAGNVVCSALVAGVVEYTDAANAPSRAGGCAAKPVLGFAVVLGFVNGALLYYFSEYESPVGMLTIASDGAAVCGLWLDGQKYHGKSIPAAMTRNDDAAGFAELRTWLNRYFAGEKPAISSVPLAPIGSEFRQAVWRKLMEIPYGQLTTYGAIAQQIAQERGGSPTSALAVGGAVGHNPVSIIIPCHRVVGADGSLTGYAGGLARKEWLLKHEGVSMDQLYIPTRGTAL